MNDDRDSARLLAAIRFAADRHRDQRRKGTGAVPYINHVIEVAEVLARVGKVTDVAVLQAAVLHDTIEDTGTTGEEIEAAFGVEVRRMVEEVTDDRSLPKEGRKRLQIERAPTLSANGRLIRIADKICNLYDVIHMPPPDWPYERQLAYLEWTRSVVAGCRGCNAELERYYDQVLAEGVKALRTRR